MLNFKALSNEGSDKLWFHLTTEVGYIYKTELNRPESSSQKLLQQLGNGELGYIHV